MQRFVTAYEGKSAPQPEMEYWYERARGKVTAFTNPPNWTLTRAAESNAEDVRLMREAVAYHRLSDRATALNRIDRAIALRPNDAYYYDLQGQILLEGRQFNGAVKVSQRQFVLAYLPVDIATKSNDPCTALECNGAVQVIQCLLVLAHILVSLAATCNGPDIVLVERNGAVKVVQCLLVLAD